MRTYTTAQRIGTRTHQCDATAVRTVNGTRAYVLLDGIGSSAEVREWTRAAAARLARTAARRGDAETGLREVYNAYAGEPERQDPFDRGWSGQPSAAAVVAVAAPGKPLTIAWCGDARAYVMPIPGVRLRCLTRDHNLRRVWPPRNGMPGGNRNVITSCLGSDRKDAESVNKNNHPVIESATWAVNGFDRLLLASDGAYEPHEDARSMTAGLVTGDLPKVAQHLVTTAETRALSASPHADNATVLVADILS